ncbi:MAG: CRISPR-associated CARF protein Csa3 [Candidatus Micrarchaeota archaeon]
MDSVGMNTTLVASFYSSEPLLACVKALMPSKIVLLHPKALDDKLKKNLEAVELAAGKFIAVEKVPVAQYDVLGVAEKAVACIDRESSAGNRVVVNFTGGRRTIGLGALFAAYARPELVDRVVYVTEESNEVLDLPKLGFNLSSSKRGFLEELNKSKPGAAVSVPDLAEKLGVTKGMAYVHLRELKAGGFINGDNKVTVAGKLALL